jgi:hypothetical protein
VLDVGCVCVARQASATGHALDLYKNTDQTTPWRRILAAMAPATSEGE